MNAIPRLKPHHGAAFFSYGFRPFFFLGACQAVLGIALWVPLFEGEISLPSVFAPRDWHVHEMLFGYLAAVVTGFLLTAIPNWTGRLPLQGAPLLGLVIIWLVGRIAVSWSDHLGWALAAVIDCAFLLLVVAAAGREIIAGENWRNLRVIVPVTVLALANIGFHLEAHVFGTATFATRVAIAAILLLIMLIGGRIIPSFTHNWLVREPSGRLPSPFGRFDVIAIALGAIALCAWIVVPDRPVTAVVLGLAAILHVLRLGRWAGERTARERLVLIFHVGYAFVPLGLALASLAAVGLVPQSAAIHAWMVGAAGTMTLAVMTRASLGHTGQQLIAGTGTQLLYLAVVLSAVTRIAGVLFPSWMLVLIHIAALGWIVAFGGFALLYGPLLFRARRSG